MNFKEASTYDIDYGFTSKLVTFLFKKDGVNVFKDKEGEFGLSDNFLNKGTVKIKEMDTEF
ncbi:hypothetical protein [Paenibacillus silvae]|uniref:Uncharacterized protein n=1 Tax=Paenibacillus silvae TaxID=1325358 RepID=A0A2W6PCT1_9BACL|nr:hypothetical protein [Paenibacillus silvae]PZT57470.1 hypothetical protein DN757_02095 [Paenibacillus silvae]